LVEQLITQIATTPTTVLSTGENGTGKELVARATHRQIAGITDITGLGEGRVAVARKERAQSGCDLWRGWLPSYLRPTGDSGDFCDGTTRRRPGSATAAGVRMGEQRIGHPRFASIAG
jgi:hypothetical protein